MIRPPLTCDPQKCHPAMASFDFGRRTPQTVHGSLLSLFLAKILSGREINSFERFPQARFCYNRSPCSASSHSSLEPSFAACAVDKVCCSKTSPSDSKSRPAQADKMRSVLLDRSQSILVGVEEFPAVAETRNRRGVASSCVSHLLATEIRSRRGRKKADLGRAPADNIPHGPGESHVGSSIHGELLMLGFDVSERSISRWMGRCPKPDPTRGWLTFLRNH